MTFTAPATDSVAAAESKRARSVDDAIGILLREDLEPDTRIAMATDLLFKSARSCNRMDNRPIEPAYRDELCIRYGRCEPKGHQFTGTCVYSPAATFTPIADLRVVS